MARYTYKTQPSSASDAFYNKTFSVGMDGKEF